MCTSVCLSLSFFLVDFVYWTSRTPSCPRHNVHPRKAESIRGEIIIAVAALLYALQLQHVPVHLLVFFIFIINFFFCFEWIQVCRCLAKCFSETLSSSLLFRATQQDDLAAASLLTIKKKKEMEKTKQTTTKKSNRLYPVYNPNSRWRAQDAGLLRNPPLLTASVPWKS